MVNVNGFCRAGSCPQISGTHSPILNVEVGAVAGISLMLCNDNRSCTSWSLWLAEFPKTFLSFLSHYPLRQVGREYLFIVILDIYK